MDGKKEALNVGQGFFYFSVFSDFLVIVMSVLN